MVNIGFFLIDFLSLPSLLPSASATLATERQRSLETLRPVASARRTTEQCAKIDSTKPKRFVMICLRLQQTLSSSRRLYCSLMDSARAILISSSSLRSVASAAGVPFSSASVSGKSWIKSSTTGTDGSVVGFAGGADTARLATCAISQGSAPSVKGCRNPSRSCERVLRERIH